MTLTLRIDRARWETHQQSLLDESPGLVPVAKGNGYGFGLRLLARATRLGVDTIAVGIAQEVAEVRAGGFAGDVVSHALVFAKTHRDLVEVGDAIEIVDDDLGEAEECFLDHGAPPD